MGSAANGFHDERLRCAISDAGRTNQTQQDDPAAVLHASAQKVQLEDEPAELIRYGSNAVFRLPNRVIGRVSRSGAKAEGVERQVAVARWLEELDYPATQVVGVEQPVVVGDRLVTFWKSVSDSETYAGLADVAALIRRLHELHAPTSIELPRLRPFGSPDAPPPSFPGLEADDAAFLQERYRWARETFDDLPFALPRGVIHGDANVGNVILDRDGRPVLIDLDSFAVGPREWDLIQTALFYDRLGWHTREEYETFVRVYGYDLLQWEGYKQLADMREIAMTAWLSRQAAESEKSAAEAAKRIAAIRTGGSRKDWSAY